MKFLVLGASGMAGHVVSIYLKERGHKVVGFSRRKVGFVESIAGDAKNCEMVLGIITAGHFDAVVNLVGILNQSAERKREEAVFLNGYFPHFLAKATEMMETQIIHISTDCVFSGHTGPYMENALQDGETFYDRSKAIGELNDDKNITLRSSIVGPDINEDGIGLLNWFMKQEKVDGYTNAMWTGLTTLQLAKAIEMAAKTKASGLVNLVYEKNISKFELLNLFNRYICKDKVKIHPYDGFVADKTLIRTNYEFGYRVPDYETMVSELAFWMQEHKDLYPHYRFAS